MSFGLFPPRAGADPEDRPYPYLKASSPVVPRLGLRLTPQGTCCWTRRILRFIRTPPIFLSVPCRPVASATKSLWCERGNNPQIKPCSQLDFARLRGVAERVRHTLGEVVGEFLWVRAMV